MDANETVFGILGGCAFVFMLMAFVFAIFFGEGGNSSGSSGSDVPHKNNRMDNYIEHRAVDEGHSLNEAKQIREAIRKYPDAFGE